MRLLKFLYFSFLPGLDPGWPENWRTGGPALAQLGVQFQRKDEHHRSLQLVISLNSAWVVCTRMPRCSWGGRAELLRCVVNRCEFCFGDEWP